MMMMAGEPSHSFPSWPHRLQVSGVDVELFAALDYMPAGSVVDDFVVGGGIGDDDEEYALAAAADVYASDEFRMYQFKIMRCARGRSHDWTECPFAHPGEKARRRDPRRFHYSGAACPDFRKGGCKKGDGCEFAHGVFECWLHPSRYRTQPCKDGTACRRRVCFFAHTPEQLRVLPAQPGKDVGGNSVTAIESYDGSPLRRQVYESFFTKSLHSPPLSPTSESPPLSPASPMSDVLATLRQLRLGKARSASAPSSWGFSHGGIGSPKGLSGMFRSGVCGSLPSTPTRAVAPPVMPMMVGSGGELGAIDEELTGTERVESGRALRAKVFEGLSRDGAVPAPDVGWVSELVN